ncbi:cell division ATP-binding protein [Bacteroidales bacterium]|nr:cell division ATP-binding protein [Bacteroidales bacterium]
MEKKVLLKYENVAINRSENCILQDVSFELLQAQFLYIIGRVGSGKSTLLKTMYCEMPINKGVAMVLDYDLVQIKRKQIPSLRKKIGIVFQDFQLLTDRTVYENLSFVLKSTGWSDKIATKRRIEEVLTQVAMINKGYKMPHELSGGEQQRVVIARALLNSPQLILADEPTGNLDPETGSHIVQLLHDISETGTAVVMSTHNYQLVSSFPGLVKKCEDRYLLDLNM